jgi:Phage major capsid protein E
MDIGGLLNQMRADGSLFRIAMNPRAQFGTKSRRYIGSELLPERRVEVNQYTEEQIRYRTVVANAGTRYSPTQKKGGALVGQFDVKLAESDIQSELTSRDYDVIVRLLQGAGALMGQPGTAPVPPEMAAAAQVTGFTETVIVQALLDVLEVWRWQAMVDKLVKLRGDNEYKEDVAYPSYAPLTFTRAADWAVDTNDPMLDIFNIVQAMADRGMVASRIITGRTAYTKFARNALIRARVGRVTVNASGQIKGTIGMATLAEINQSLNADGLPPIELYDLQYRTTTGSQFFLRRDAMVVVATTGRNETLDLGDGIFETLEDTVGYTAIGRAAGQATPGRVIRLENREDKPPRIFSEGWQTALPVITEPEAIGVINGI